MQPIRPTDTFGSFPAGDDATTVTGTVTAN